MDGVLGTTVDYVQGWEVTLLINTNWSLSHQFDWNQRTVLPRMSTRSSLINKIEWLKISKPLVKSINIARKHFYLFMVPWPSLTKLRSPICCRYTLLKSKLIPGYERETITVFSKTERQFFPQSLLKIIKFIWTSPSSCWTRSAIIFHFTLYRANKQSYFPLRNNYHELQVLEELK